MLIYNFQDFEEMFVHLSIPLCDQGNQLHLYRVHNLPLKVDIDITSLNKIPNDDIDITTLTKIPNDDTGKVRDGYSVTADLDTEYLLTAK